MRMFSPMINDIRKYHSIALKRNFLINTQVGNKLGIVESLIKLKSTLLLILLDLPARNSDLIFSAKFGKSKIW